MMWIFFTVILLFLGDIYGQSCRESFETECASIEPPERFPMNEEELAHACRFAHKQMSCMANVAENCEDEENSRMASVANQLVSSLEKVCDPESQGYIAISKNLECISAILPSLERKCNPRDISEKRRNLTMAYAETVKDKERPEGNVNMLQDCMSVIFEISCFTALISEECGSEIFQPTLNTLMELARFNLEPVCPQETIEEIPMFAFAYAMAEKEAHLATHELEEPMQAPSFDQIFSAFKK